MDIAHGRMRMIRTAILGHWPVEGFRFRLRGSGVGVYGLRFTVYGLRLRVEGLGIVVYGLEFRVQGLGVRFKVQD